uniref:S-protein homolog n=1 Tax=Panagrolaimus sp. ES5 TaxID=591445 RepID=A0AC34FVP5_9BILA
MNSFKTFLVFASVISVSAIIPAVFFGLSQTALHVGGSAAQIIKESVEAGTDEKYVKIQNTMGKDVEATVRCASGDDTIEEQHLKDGEAFAWKFTPNALGSTLFYCDVETNNGKSARFDAYTDDRRRDMDWFLRGDGIYWGNADGTELEKWYDL